MSISQKITYKLRKTNWKTRWKGVIVLEWLAKFGTIFCADPISQYPISLLIGVRKWDFEGKMDDLQKKCPTFFRKQNHMFHLTKNLIRGLSLQIRWLASIFERGERGGKVINLRYLMTPYTSWKHSRWKIGVGIPNYLKISKENYPLKSWWWIHIMVLKNGVWYQHNRKSNDKT